MRATILLSVPGDMEEYPYGTYGFDTPAEQDKVNSIAEQLRDQRGVNVRISTED